MKDFATVSIVVLSLLVAYIASYVALRCTTMHFGANRRMVNGVRIIRTYVYFGDGDNSCTRVARMVYFPLHKAEHTWKLWRNAPFAYE